MKEYKANILLVEDDMNLGFVVQDNLKMNGYNVVLATDGETGLTNFNEKKFDLCIFDVMLPKKDGFALAEDVRKINATIPIVFLTAKSMVEDKIKGFKIGADDYITKPFSNEEFLLRVEAILKRSNKNIEHTSDILNIGKYIYEVQNYKLTFNKKTKTLTKKEGDILKLLCENINKVIDRKLITSLVWGNDDYFVGRSLDVFITKLRKHLSEDEKVTITNVHGVGFMLEV